jgi:hypothetical protein
MIVAMRELVGRGVLGGAIAVAAIAAGTLPDAAGAYTPPPSIVWVSLLPGLPTATNPQFHGVPGCPIATMACIDTEITRMDALRVKLGCDHRAVFATTYELLTITLRDAMLANPHLFADPAWVIGEDATFANLYFNSISAYARHRPVPAAWRIAFETAGHGNQTAVQDMLLGINAHVQRDMPHMLAAVGLHTPDGASRKHDHDVVNDVLNAAFARVTNTITRRFDPSEGFIAPSSGELFGLTGNVLGDQLVEGWRELVWRNAEGLLDARTRLQHALLNGEIEGNAATTARMIAAFQLPGYRASRDAYCAAHNVGPL